MADRDYAIETFLGAVGWAGARREPLAADASFRRYERLHLNDTIAILMDAPPPKEDVTPFLRIARHLSAFGFSAPRILGEDVKRGFLLLEDLGDATYTRRLAAGANEDELYTLATDTLIRLHELLSAENAPAETQSYDMDRLLPEAMLLVEWYLPAVTGQPTPDIVVKTYKDTWTRAFANVANKRETLVLRDYHVDNLMLLPNRMGVQRCGLLDFQDALVGARAYDLMSLVEDARRDIRPELRKKCIDRYLAAFPAVERKRFEADLAVLGAGRHAKVIGIFTRLWKRDGKAQYVHHIPRVWKLLERSLQHPELQPLLTWFDATIPPEQRRQPALEDA